MQSVEARGFGDDAFPKTLKVRVRAHLVSLLDRLDGQLKATTLDGQCVDRLAGALAKLSEVERQLAGRPMPGSLRPRAAKDERRRGSKLDLSDA